MKYHGGKTRSGKKISNIIQEIIDNDENIEGYCEPFCGACGVIKHLPQNNDKLTFLAGDTNGSMIEMWKSLQIGWEPDISNVSKEYYLSLKGNGESSAQKGFIGHCLSFGGLYFKVYMEELVLRIGTAKKNVIRRGECLDNVTFSNGDYTQFSHLKKNIIFCDPPYQKLNKYYDEYDNRLKFDHDSFWDWCGEMKKNNVIIVNEMSGIEKAISLSSKVVEFTPRNLKYGKYSNSETESLYIMGD